MHIYEVLRRPLLTEKTVRQRELANQYAFEIDRRANRHQVKEAVEAVFPNVTVTNVRIVNMPAKHKRSLRRQVVRHNAEKGLRNTGPGGSIQVFEGI
ncbi:MAG: 50S ribosomal protein L23 [Anaerolineae bacterium]|nr:MAG: 50S ribosomal protein L23 [Anaerolineae bacterium]